MKKIIFGAFLLVLSFSYSKDECTVSLCESETRLSCLLKSDTVYSIKVTRTLNQERYNEWMKKNGFYPYKGPCSAGNYCFAVDPAGLDGREGSQSQLPDSLFDIKEHEVFYCSIKNNPDPNPSGCSLRACTAVHGPRQCFHSYGSIFYKTDSYDPGLFCTLKNGEEEPEAPCFGNVDDCNATTPPDYVDPETGIPCWGELCGQTLPPDYVDPETGVPCWGDKCGTGGPGGDGPGGDGPGGDGDTEETCVGDWCVELPSNGSLGDGKVIDMPNTFWDQKEKETLRDKYKREIERKNPYDFKKISTNISGSAMCPVFKFDFFGDISPPCWLWEMLGTFFAFCATFMSFVIVFWRR